MWKEFEALTDPCLNVKILDGGGGGGRGVAEGHLHGNG